jgi:hypothetical protein
MFSIFCAFIFPTLVRRRWRQGFPFVDLDTPIGIFVADLSRGRNQEGG